MRRPDSDHRYAAGGYGSGGGWAPGAGPGTVPGGPPSGRVPGPRQEYLDAFDAPEDRGTATLPAPAEPVIPGQSTPGGPPDRPRNRHRRPRARRGKGWGRTATGLAAAGVVTALAISVTGQLADGERDGSAAGRGEPAGRSGDAPNAAVDGSDGPGEHVERSGEREPVTPEAEDGPEPPGYEEAMDSLFDLDPELTGSGELVPVPGTDPGPHPDAPVQLRYRVDVEEGLGLDPELFAEAVHRTLSDPRSWGNDGQRSFSRVSSGNHDFVITLASPGTTAEWCAKSGLNTTVDNVSCDSANTERVMINAWRWAQGADTFGPDRIHEYRQMLINHEVGHRIGYGHAVCPEHGAPAPVMMQQTKFLTMNGLTCEPNPWPKP